MVLAKSGRIEDEEAFWLAVERYFEEADAQAMRIEDIASAIRGMRVGKPLIP